MMNDLSGPSILDAGKDAGLQKLSRILGLKTQFSLREEDVYIVR